MDAVRRETVDNVEGQLKCVVRTARMLSCQTSVSWLTLRVELRCQPDLQEVEAMKALRTILDVDSEDLTLRVDSGDGDPWGEEAEEVCTALRLGPSSMTCMHAS